MLQERAPRHLSGGCLQAQQDFLTPISPGKDGVAQGGWEQRDSDQTPLPVPPGKGCWLSPSPSPASLHLSSLLKPSSDKKGRHLKTVLDILLTGVSSLIPQVSKGVLFKVGECQALDTRDLALPSLGERLSCNGKHLCLLFHLWGTDIKNLHQLGGIRIRLTGDPVYGPERPQDADGADR